MPTRPAVDAEVLTVRKTASLHPARDPRFRQPEHLHVTTSTHRPDGVQGLHGGGRNGHHGTVSPRVILGTDHGDAAAAVISILSEYHSPPRCYSPCYDASDASQPANVALVCGAMDSRRPSHSSTLINDN